MSCLLYGFLLQLSAFQLGQRGECWQQEGAQCLGDTDAHQNFPTFSFTQTTKLLMEKMGRKKKKKKAGSPRLIMILVEKKKKLFFL